MTTLDLVSGLVVIEVMYHCPLWNCKRLIFRTVDFRKGFLQTIFWGGAGIKIRYFIKIKMILKFSGNEMRVLCKLFHWRSLLPTSSQSNGSPLSKLR